MYSRSYKRYVTLLLLIVYISNRVDVAVFAYLMESIKRELHLSDTQLGFLAGPALVLVYATLGIPVARLADRASRVNIMSVAIALWSGVVTLTATVGTFWQFALARVGVGVGEAGFSAVAQSLLSDYHTPPERTRALSIFMLALPLAGVVSSLTGGWINQAYGWRAAFLVVGMPGIVLSFLMKFTVREPARRQNASVNDEPPRPSLRLVLSTLWQRRALRHLAIAQAVANTVVACMATWIPAFFIRNHGVATGELGSWLAVVFGLGGSAGILLGGYLPGRFGSQDERKQVRLMAIVTALVTPTLAVVLWWPSKQVALSVLLPAQVLMMFFFGPTFSLVQGLCAASMRATMAAVFILIQVLAGGVVGIQLLGIFSDVLAPVAGNSGLALRWGMTLISVLSLWAAVHFWLAAGSIREDLVDVDPAT